MSKHTPGPWELERSSVLIPIGPDEWIEVDAGTEANARLIAAAPDLLEALRKIAAIENKTVGSDWEEIEEARGIARAAIAAACRASG